MTELSKLDDQLASIGAKRRTDIPNDFEFASWVLPRAKGQLLIWSTRTPNVNDDQVENLRTLSEGQGALPPIYMIERNEFRGAYTVLTQETIAP